MTNSIYTTLSRQIGLMREMDLVANNIANLSTTGYRRQGVVFAEHVRQTGPAEPSLSMTEAKARIVDLQQGTVEETGGSLDLAIRGDGFFMVETGEGPRLTRAGAFAVDAAGTVVSAAGDALLDDGGAPIVLPPGGGAVSIARDGTVSAGQTPVGRVGLFRPADPKDLVYQAGTLFQAEGGVVPQEGEAEILQGYVEHSNVDPVGEIARMIAVQRAYELGQKLLDREDQRLRDLIQTATK